MQVLYTLLEASTFITITLYKYTSSRYDNIIDTEVHQILYALKYARQ